MRDEQCWVEDKNRSYIIIPLKDNIIPLNSNYISLYGNVHVAKIVWVFGPVESSILGLKCHFRGLWFVNSPI